MLVPPPHRADAATPSVADIHALLANRSPGARGAGALYQTKLALDGSSPLPHERVLDVVRDHPAGPDGGVPGAAPGVADALPGGVAPADAAEGVPADEGVAGQPSFADNGLFGVPAIGGVAAPAGGGSASDAGATSPPAATAVPEPATWLAMLLGFVAVGLALRRRPGVAAFYA